MICINCAKRDAKKIEMSIDGPGKRYICAECGFILTWKEVNFTLINN
jgi:RNase P subunit RPR2